MQIVKLNIRNFNNINDLLSQLIHICIEFDIVQDKGDKSYFDLRPFVNEINNANRCRIKRVFICGTMYLDDETGASGVVRLISRSLEHGVSRFDHQMWLFMHDIQGSNTKLVVDITQDEEDEKF